MKFGSVENPGEIDFTLPQDHPDTTKVLSKSKSKKLAIHIGCAKWNKTDLKIFYPKGTKDELTYYSTQFNSIELNATFYGMPKKEQVIEWYNKTPSDFKFFPKLTNSISHFRRLNNVGALVEEYCNIVSNLKEKLGMTFLQLHDNFKPKDFDKLVKVVEDFPKGIPLAVEVRNKEWLEEKEIADNLFKLLLKYGVTSVLVDSAGRRDLLHMRLTTPKTFIRYVGANHPTDYTRLDEWIERIISWREAGLKELNFFIHQNIELASPLLSAYFTEQLNARLGTKIKIPATLIKPEPPVRK